MQPERVQFASLRLAINAGRIVNQMSELARAEGAAHARQCVSTWEKRRGIVHRASHLSDDRRKSGHGINKEGQRFSVKLRVSSSHVLPSPRTILKPAKISAAKFEPRRRPATAAGKFFSAGRNLELSASVQSVRRCSWRCAKISEFLAEILTVIKQLITQLL